MRIQTILALVVCAGPAVAQQMMPIPAYSSTFSVSSAARGFWFQAPVDFAITGLRVPDEQNHGLQNVEVFIMPSAPPAYPSTGTGVQVFFAAGVPSSQIIPTSIPVQANDFVGVLGACGDASIHHNSYGSRGTFTSDILGNPVVIDRFLTQFNLVTTGGNNPYSTEPGGTISRVEVYVAPACSGSISRGGQGCADAGGVTNRIDYRGCPDLGDTLGLDIEASPSSTGQAYLIIGLSDTVWFGLQLPLDLTLFGAPGCTVYTSHEVLVGPLGFSNGTASVNLPIPNNPALLGTTSHHQGYHVSLGANPLSLALTDYLTLVIG